MIFPHTTRSPSFTATSPGNLPCTESYLSWYAMYCTFMKGSFTATTSTAGLATAARNTNRPMRPKPLMPMRHTIFVRMERPKRGKKIRNIN